MITVDENKLREVLDRCEMVSTEGSHAESCMAIAEAFKELRSMLEQKPSDDEFGDDCAPNHLCGKSWVHLPQGEQCDRCGYQP